MSNFFCTIALGRLGEVGKFSLRSILRIPNWRLVVFVDKTGEEWIRELCIQENYDISRIHFIYISLEDENLLNRLDSSVEYRSFGNPKFFRLMYFKWLVLKEAMRLSGFDSVVIFTDLDVYWARSPETSLSSLMKSKTLFSVQQDVKSGNDKVFLCPGIMAWKTNARAYEVLESLRSSHEVLLKTNPTMPDDKALNLWASREENFELFSLLSRKEYVIGHRIIYLLLGLGGYKIGSMVAYHANYVVGITGKAQLLRFASTRKYNLILRFSRAMFLILQKCKKKLNS